MTNYELQPDGKFREVADPPTRADLVQVVRCRDCEYFNEHDPNRYQQINHIDEDKTNNHVSNLEWCTPRYNNAYGTRLERCGKRISKPVVGINGEVLMRFNSARQASRALGIDASSITAVCRGKAHTAGGYVWRYDNKRRESE